MITFERYTKQRTLDYSSFNSFAQMNLQIRRIPTLNLVQNFQFYQTYNPPLHHLANSYSKILILRGSLIVNDISFQFGENFRKGTNYLNLNLKTYNP
jgi:hypothetical protein